MSHHRDAWFQTKVSQNTRFFIRNAQFRSDSMIVATMMKKRPSSASCPLPTSVISHGAVSPLLWKMLHDVWHVPPLPPAPSQPVQSCMALFLLSCGRCCMYGTFLLHVPSPPPAPSQPAQSRIVLFLLSCVSCFMYGTFLFTKSLF